jgi:phosphoglycerate dehydrogenase-like enzyme
MAPRPRTVLAMNPDLVPLVLGDLGGSRLHEVADVVEGVVLNDFGTFEAFAALREAEVLFTHWGCPPLDERVLDAAPRLRAVVHAAGSVKGHVTEACWRRGILVSSAVEANGRPVAEYTVAAILISNKRLLAIRDDYRANRTVTDWHWRYPQIGNYQRTIGIVGASRIGRRVIELLRPFDLRVQVYDPWLDEAGAVELGVRSVGLDELCATSDVVSLHAPQLPATRHMIDRRRLALMPDGATIVNTARGPLLDTEALVDELATGRLNAVLDVTDPDPVAADSHLFDLPNVLLTPHVAGSVGNELRRMTDSAIGEVARYAAGVAFAHPVLHHGLEHAA